MVDELLGVVKTLDPELELKYNKFQPTAHLYSVTSPSQILIGYTAFLVLRGSKESGSEVVPRKPDAPPPT